MNLIKHTRKFVAAAAVVASVAGGAWINSAHATVVENDTVKISGGKIDLGNGSLSNGAPSSAGSLDWDVSGGVVTPKFTGKLFIDDQGFCGRVREDFYDENGTFLTTIYGGEVCQKKADTLSATVDLHNYSSPDVAQVDISTELRLTNGTFGITGTVHREMGGN